MSKLLLSLLSLAALAPASRATEPLFTTDVSLYANHDQIFYRLPSLLVTSRGTVLAASQKRVGSGNDWAPSSLVLRRSHDGGQTFDPEQTLFEAAGDCVFNGNLVEDRSTGTLFACFIALPQVGGGSWFTKTWIPQGGGFSYVKSTDDGKTWSARVDVMPVPNANGWHGGGAFNNNHGIQLQEGPHAGRLVIAARVFKPGVMEAHSKGGLIYSDDHGATWHVGAVMLPQAGAINSEVTLGEAPGGEVYVNSRNEAGRKDKSRAPAGVDHPPEGIVPNRRIYSRSRDGGESFYAEGCHSELWDGRCNAGQTAVPGQGGEAYSVLLFTAPTVGRSHLTAYLSRDGGHTWSRAGLISEKSGAYSDDATLPDGTILTLYENAKEPSHPPGLLIARYNLAGLLARQ